VRTAKGDVEWQYCVQYREAAFNLVALSMEHKGILYYFRYEEGKYRLVLTDLAGGYTTCGERPGQVLPRVAGWGHDLATRSTAEEDRQANGPCAVVPPDANRRPRCGPTPGGPVGRFGWHGLALMSTKGPAALSAGGVGALPGNEEHHPASETRAHLRNSTDARRGGSGPSRRVTN
jgi:hypothetical protein